MGRVLQTPNKEPPNHTRNALVLGGISVHAVTERVRHVPMIGGAVRDDDGRPSCSLFLYPSQHRAV